MSARLAEFFDKVEKSRILKYIEDGNYTDSQKEKLKLEWNNIDWSLVYSYQNNKQAQLVAEYRINNMAGVYRCGLCKHPLGQDAELTELHRIKPGAIGGKYTYSPPQGRTKGKCNTST